MAYQRLLTRPIRLSRRFLSVEHQPREYEHEGIIDVSPLAAKMREQVRAYTASLSKPPRLMGLLATSGPYRADAEIYSERIAETFAEDAIDYQLVRCPGESVENVEGVVRRLNADASVDGILVFYPIFKHRQKKGPYLNKSTGVYYKTNDDYLRDLVAKDKDVEGLCHHYNARRLFRARGMQRDDNEVYVPCTALAVKKILETYHDHLSPGLSRWSGLHVTIVNRSEIMGRPLAALLALEGATVYSIDDESILLFKEGGRMRLCHNLTLEECLAQSSVVVTGVPSPDFALPSRAIAEGTTVVNVAEFLNVDEETLLERPNVKLIPHVGKVTVAALEQNLIQLHKRKYKRLLEEESCR